MTGIYLKIEEVPYILKVAAGADLKFTSHMITCRKGVPLCQQNLPFSEMKQSWLMATESSSLVCLARELPSFFNLRSCAVHCTISCNILPMAVPNMFTLSYFHHYLWWLVELSDIHRTTILQVCSLFILSQCHILTMAISWKLPLLLFSRIEGWPSIPEKWSVEYLHQRLM